MNSSLFQYKEATRAERLTMCVMHEEGKAESTASNLISSNIHSG